MSDSNKVVDVILHCQKQIKKERLPEEKLLHYLGRLSRLRITVPDLAATGIGRTVNSLSRNEGPVGQAAETLVRGWKRMVSEQQSQEEPEPESEDESDSNSGSSEEEDDEVNNDAREPDPERYEPVVKLEPEPYQDQAAEVHQVVPDPVENSPKRIEGFADDDEEEDEIDDPYMDGGFMLNVHTDEEEEEEEDDENDKDSDASDSLRIADDEPPKIKREIEDLKVNSYIKQEPHHIKRESEDLKVNTYIKQEPQPLDSAYVDKGKEHKRSYDKGSHSHSSGSSNSKPHHHHHQRSSSKDHSPSSKESTKEHEHKESRDHRPSKHNDPSPDKKSRHHHSSSSHHEKERSSSRDKHRSKESSSSHREVKSEKERSKEKKDSSHQSRSSSSSGSQHKDKTRKEKESSIISSSPVRIKSEFNEERKRKDQTDNGSLTSPSSKKSKLVIKEEIDSTSGVNFSDVLGSLDVPSSSSSSSSKHKKIKKEESEKSHGKEESRKRKHESPNSSGSSKHSQERESRGGSSRKHEADSEVIKLSRKPMHAKIEGVIKPVVDISPNYKPMHPLVPPFSRQGTSNGSATTLSLSHAEISDMGNVDYWDNPEKEHTEMSQEDAISTMLSNRNARSKVFSGVKSTRKGGVPKLYDLCMQVIKDNIGDLGYTGGIPYDILKPALERANPHQLMNIESQNDHLIGETDELWQFHCKRDFRGTCPEETESWRELYERCKDGQQQRFEQIKKKMKLDRMKKETAEPQRKTKLAFIDTSGGPRFHKEKAQTIKNGMKTLKIKEEKGGRTGATSSASAGFNNPKVSGDPTKVIVQEASVIIAAGSRSGHAPAPSVSRDRGESVAKVKPKKAPLMQKTMKLIRSLNRR